MTAAPLPSLPRWFLLVVAAFVRRELASVAGYRVAFFTQVFGFLFVLVGLVFFSRFVGAAANPHLAAYGGNYLGFVAIGYLAAELQQVGVTGLARRVRTAQVMGTLEAELAAPAPPWMVLSATPLYEFGGAALRSAGYLVAAVMFVGLSLPRVNAWTLVISVPLILAAFMGLGLVTAASTMLARRTNPVAVFLGSLSVFLSGVIYPVTVLPVWLQQVGRMLPLTHALRALRAGFLVGAPPGAIRGSLVALAIFAAVLIPGGAALFSFALRRARVDGSLTHY
jgi:ABC-2 type transport system permease protein